MGEWNDYIKCESCGHVFTRFVLMHAKACLVGYKPGHDQTSCIECSLDQLKPIDLKKIKWEHLNE